MKLIASEARDWTSSLIKHTQYNPEDKELLIVFKNGQQYLYSEVTDEEYQNFCKAESQGSFFAKNFRTKKFTKLEAETNTTTDGNPQS
jgi:hypothetical protein